MSRMQVPMGPGLLMQAYAQDASDEFDPEGSGYDYANAWKHGIFRGADGHMASRVPETGQLLKGRKHETWGLLEAGEEKAGYAITKGADGKYYSFPKQNEGAVMSRMMQLPMGPGMMAGGPMPPPMPMNPIDAAYMLAMQGRGGLPPPIPPTIRRSIRRRRLA